MPRLLQILFAAVGSFFFFSCAHLRPVPAESHYTSDMFIRALNNNSTAPDFVLITVVDARSNDHYSVCTAATALKGALHMESGIPYDETGERQVYELAITRTNRVFRFSKPDALRNVQASYTQTDLDAVRTMTASWPDSDLLNKELVQSIYMSQSSRHKRARYQRAVAHVLLERGIGCRRGCVIGDLNPYK